ncbi:hypothetical protein DRJ17_03905 [Candidatus Woesearchaeota archaeon]|nr:MAG: hypothetical protein DRJ17_03905 [Candidatus Woesearchaeota archaeon]
MEIETLENLGLTKNESTIYLALLKLGSAPISKISKDTRLNRANMYNTIESLVSKGLVSYVIKNNVKYFKATNPAKLHDILKEKEKQLNKIMPKLQAIQKVVVEKQKVEVYEGKEGLKTFYSEMLRTKKPVYVLGATGKAFELLKFYVPKIAKEIIKKFGGKIIVMEKAKNKEVAKLKNAEIRFLPKEYSNIATTIIYGNKIAIQIIEEKPIIIIIENKTIAAGYKKYFEFMWSNCKISNT